MRVRCKREIVHDRQALCVRRILVAGAVRLFRGFCCRRFVVDVEGGGEGSEGVEAAAVVVEGCEEEEERCDQGVHRIPVSYGRHLELVDLLNLRKD